MPTITLYHGSPTWFERPDPDYAGMGDGQSVYGLGFNVSDNLPYVRDHIKTQRDAADRSVIYSVDIDSERLFDSYAPLSAKWLDQAIGRSTQLGLDGLSANLRDLRTEANTGGPGKDLNNSVLRNEIRRAFPDQRLENEFLRGMGVQTIRTLDVWVVVDYDNVPPLKVHEVLGQGPANMPATIKPGDLAAKPARNDTAQLMAAGDLKSSELSSAWRHVNASGDDRLAKAFRKLAKILVSDDWIADPDPWQPRTRAQNAGFDVRNAVGLAVQHGLIGGNPTEAIGEMHAVLGRLDGHLDRYVDDDRIKPLLGELAKALVSRCETNARDAVVSQAVAVGDHELPVRGPESDVLTRLAVTGKTKAFCLANAAFRAIDRFEFANPVPGQLDSLRTEMARAFKVAATPGATGEQVDRAIMPLAVELGRLGRNDRWLPELSNRIVQSVRAFASLARRGDLNLDAARPLSPGDVKVAAPVAAVTAAASGEFRLPQGIEFPIAGMRGWTVAQNASGQSIKHDGKLANLEDGTTVLPAIIGRDGRGVAVSYDADGRQNTVRTNVSSVRLEDRQAAMASMRRHGSLDK